MRGGARRAAPEAYPWYVEGAGEGANDADGPLSAAARQAARRAEVTGRRAARIAGGRPPRAPITSAHAIPRRIRAGVTRKSKATWENVSKLRVESVAPSQ